MYRLIRNIVLDQIPRNKQVLAYIKHDKEINKNYQSTISKVEQANNDKKCGLVEASGSYKNESEIKHISEDTHQLSTLALSETSFVCLDHVKVQCKKSNHVEHLEAKISKLEQARNTDQVDLIEANARSASYKDQLERQYCKLAKLEATHQQTVSMLSETTMTCLEQIEAQVVALDEVAHLKRQIKLATTASEETQGRLENEAFLLNEQLKEDAIERQELLYERQELLGEVDWLEQELAKKNDEVARKDDEMAILKRDVQAFDTKVVERLNSYKETNTELANENVKYKASLEKARLEILAYQAQVRTLKEENKKQKRKYRERISFLKGQFQRLKHRIWHIRTTKKPLIRADSGVQQLEVAEPKPTSSDHTWMKAALKAMRSQFEDSQKSQEAFRSVNILLDRELQSHVH